MRISIVQNIDNDKMFKRKCILNLGIILSILLLKQVTTYINNKPFKMATRVLALDIGNL